MGKDKVISVYTVTVTVYTITFNKLNKGRLNNWKEFQILTIKRYHKPFIQFRTH